MIVQAIKHILPSASIRRKLVVGVAFVHLLLMTIFVFDLVHRQRDFLWQELTQRTLHHAEVLAISASSWMLSDDLAGMEEVVEGSSRGASVRYAMLVDPVGRILAHTDREKIGLYLSDKTSLEALAGTKQARVYQQDTSAVHALAPIIIANHLVGWSMLSVDKVATTAHLTYVTRTGILYTLAAIAIGTLFAVLLARSILGQLKYLLAGVDNLQKNILDTPVPVISNDEVGRVARAFNRAVSSLAESRAQLTSEIAERRRVENALRALSRRQVSLIEDERNRIARDLHDELGQALSGMQFCLKALQEEVGMKQHANASATLAGQVERMGVAIHRIANDLRPSTLDHLGLIPAIKAFVTDQQPLVGDRVHIAVDAAGFKRRLPPEVEMTAYRIVQEGLSNAIKHAGARRIDIMLTVNHPTLIVIIRDDGIGIDAAMPGQTHNVSSLAGIGILGMQERAGAIGGTVEIKARKESGTVLRAELPYAGEYAYGDARIDS